jgi:hypothetical protein
MKGGDNMKTNLQQVVRRWAEAEDRLQQSREAVTEHLVSNGMHEYFKVDWPRLRKLHDETRNHQQQMKDEIE